MAQYFDKLFSNTEFEIESTANALIMVFWFLRNLKRMLNHMNTKIIILRTIWIKMRWYRTEIREVIEFFGTHLKFRDLNITWNDAKVAKPRGDDPYRKLASADIWMAISLLVTFHRCVDITGAQ